uniref:Soluble interferon alpha/beta receptor OPG204 n=1 Tax=Clastoptera arizonana TaxID=38151 RepID=A0A1B6DGY4_9HEMI
MNRLQFWFVCVLCVFAECLAQVDFCNQDRRNASLSSPGLQFTKELSGSEYAVGSNFKSLHCCAKGYRSIEWFKDDKAYPWPGDVSSFILYPESANQTIYSKALGVLDAGNYTCRVVNDSLTISHTTSLKVFDTSAYMDDPLPTYMLPNEHFVRLGDTARLYCEAFVGSSDLPDAANEVEWIRPGVNVSEEDQKRFMKKEIIRESKQIIGAYLFIRKVVKLDLGEYVCRISNAGDQIIRLSTVLREEEWVFTKPDNSVPWSSLILVTCACILSSLTVLMIYKRFALSVVLFLKQNLCKTDDSDNKEYDVMVCYSEKDAAFVLGVLKPALQHKYDYSTIGFQISAESVTPELKTAASLSRRLLVVLSPSLVDNQWTPATLYQTLNKLSNLHTNIICLFIKPLPQRELYKTDDGIKLKTLLQKTKVIQWENSTPLERRRFWTSLRLYLPIPTKKPVMETNVLTAINTSATEETIHTPFSKSNESLEILV